MIKPSALRGLRVLDFSRVLAGPYCSMLLADFGADVIKVESLSGDDTRRWGPPWLDGESAYYLSVNRNKRSIAIDLKHAQGQEIARRLADRADVIIENFKVGGMANFNLDYPTLAGRNPGLIYCSITGYGQTGPKNAQAGYDFIIQAEAGIMSITGEAEGVPSKVGVAVVDVTAGLYASHAILAALHFREKTGLGQYIDVALFDAQLGWLVNVAQNYLVSSENPRRYGNAHPSIVPYQTFETLDGHLALGVGNDRQYHDLCHAINRPDLWHDLRFQTNPGRVVCRDELIPVLAEVFKAKSTSEWLSLLLRENIPAGPINDIPAALNDPQVVARDSVREIESGGRSAIKQIAPVARLSETPAGIFSAPPGLGEQTCQILLDELGLSLEEVKKLGEQGVIAY